MKFKIIPVLALLLSACSAPEIPQQVKNDLDSIAAEWVPDRREALCDYEVHLLNRKEAMIKGETTVPEAKKELIEYLEASGYQVTDSIRILPDAGISKKWGIVCVSVCSLMNIPSFSGEQVSQAVMGTPVRILKQSGGWIFLQTPDHYLGWVTDAGVSEKTDEDMTAWKGAARIIYPGREGEILNNQDAPGIISDITAGAILEMTGMDSHYYQVKTPDGRQGRITRNVPVDFDAWASVTNPEPVQMIQFARSMTGFPYMWGGTSTKAVDCSGFVKTIYFMSGTILARDASQQFLYGKPVDVSESIDLLEPGDLLFFGHLRDDGSRRITHVGMYIGDTEVIHSSGMVRINSLDSRRPNFSSYLKETLMGARRLTGVSGQPGIQPVNQHPWYFNQQQVTSNK